jgi:hypothetical protein
MILFNKFRIQINLVPFSASHLPSYQEESDFIIRNSPYKQNVGKLGTSAARIFTNVDTEWHTRLVWILYMSKFFLASPLAVRDESIIDI